MGNRGREFNPSLFGKANTLAQVTAVAAVLYGQVNRAPQIAACAAWALYATMVLTCVSGLHYAWVAARRVGATGANGHAGR